MLYTPLSNHFNHKGDNKEGHGKISFSHPKVELTHFKGKYPRTWIRNYNKFFLFHQISDLYKCDLGEIYFDGKDITWF